jgi:hypothetical protein
MQIGRILRRGGFRVLEGLCDDVFIPSLPPPLIPS